MTTPIDPYTLVVGETLLFENGYECTLIDATVDVAVRWTDSDGKTVNGIVSLAALRRPDPPPLVPADRVYRLTPDGWPIPEGDFGREWWDRLHPDYPRVTVVATPVEGSS